MHKRTRTTVKSPSALGSCHLDEERATLKEKRETHREKRKTLVERRKNKKQNNKIIFSKIDPKEGSEYGKDFSSGRPIILHTGKL